MRCHTAKEITNGVKGHKPVKQDFFRIPSFGVNGVYALAAIADGV